MKLVTVISVSLGVLYCIFPTSRAQFFDQANLNAGTDTALNAGERNIAQLDQVIQAQDASSLVNITIC